MRKTAYLPIGTISDGALRPEDVLPALLDTADRVRLSRADRRQVAAIRRAVDAADAEYWQHGAAEDIDALTMLLDAYAPPLCYVGMLGACLGVWPIDLSYSAVDEDHGVYRSGNVPGEDAEETRAARAAGQYWLHVNDHGNATLYEWRRGRGWRAIWSVV